MQNGFIILVKLFFTFRNKVLRQSAGIQETGQPLWDLTLCLLLAWIVIFLCLAKGVKSSGKVGIFNSPLTSLNQQYEYWLYPSASFPNYTQKYRTIFPVFPELWWEVICVSVYCSVSWSAASVEDFYNFPLIIPSFIHWLTMYIHLPSLDHTWHWMYRKLIAI